MFLICKCPLNYPRKHLFYYRGSDLYAVRFGNFKAHFITQGEYGQFGGKKIHSPPLLYDLNKDPSEKYNISKKNTDILKQIDILVSYHKEKMIHGSDQLKSRGYN